MPNTGVNIAMVNQLLNSTDAGSELMEFTKLYHQFGLQARAATRISTRCDIISTYRCLVHLALH